MPLAFLFHSSLVLIFDPFAFFFTKKAMKMRICSLFVGWLDPGVSLFPSPSAHQVSATSSF